MFNLDGVGVFDCDSGLSSDVRKVAEHERPRGLQR